MCIRDRARTDESEQYESMKVRIRYMYQNSGIGYLEALLESGSFAKMLKQVDYMSTMMQYDRAKLEEYQQTQVLIQNAEETIRKDKADLEALSLIHIWSRSWSKLFRGTAGRYHLL